MNSTNLQILKNKFFWQVKLEISKNNSLLIEEFFLESGAIGSYELLFNIEESRLFADNTILFFFFHEKFPVTAFVPMALELLNEVSNYTIESIKYEDYIKLFEQSFTSFPLTNTTWLIPPWEISKELNNKVKHKLFLKPGMAFGTGKHATTRLCVEWLENNAKANHNLIEIGCGSGILSIAALLFGATKVTGVDVEALAIDSANENTELNQENFNPRATWNYEINDFSGCLKQIDGDLNIFISNILPDIFFQNEASLIQYLEIAQNWALSGIPVEKKKNFSNWLTKLGHPHKINELEGWTLFSKS